MVLCPNPVYPQWTTSYMAVPPPVGSAWFEFSFATPYTGYLVLNQLFSVSTGYNYTFLKTTDGGLTWSTDDKLTQPDLSPNGSFCIDVAMTHPDTMFYTLHSYFDFLMWRTPGGTGSYRLLAEAPRDLSAVNGHEAFVLTHGYILDDISVYYFNGDSTRHVFQSTSYHADQTAKIFFVNAQVGFVIVKDLTMKAVLLKSMDGGQTFAPVALPSGMTPLSLFFPTDSIGFIAGNSGMMFRTNDQGSTWQQLFAGTTASLNEVHFANSQAGMACGSGGVAIMTLDGGETWQNHPCSGNLTDIQFFSETRAYTCNNSYFPVFFKGIYPVSTQNLTKEEFNVYPNPAIQNLNVELPFSCPNAVSFEITGVTGNTLLKGDLLQGFPLSIESIPAGIFILKVFTPQKTLITKFVKRK